ncbi:MAG: hypothetical protein IPM39_07825 [Chloroflexi bacterium]|nr:hypothetical protein [Chloroflexota bacterium]
MQLHPRFGLQATAAKSHRLYGRNKRRHLVAGGQPHQAHAHIFILVRCATHHPHDWPVGIVNALRQHLKGNIGETVGQGAAKLPGFSFPLAGIFIPPNDEVQRLWQVFDKRGELRPRLGIENVLFVVHNL